MAGARKWAAGGVWIGAALMVTAVRVLPAEWIPPCRFHRWTGWPCPTCGFYRGLRFLSQGAWREAWRMQPLVVVLVVATLCWAGLELCARPAGRAPSSLSPATRWIAAAAVLAAVLLNWIYLLMAGI